MVLSEKNNFLIFLIITLFFFYILYRLTLAPIANQSLQIFITIFGLGYVVAEMLLILIISMFIGVFVSLFIYKIQITRKAFKTGFFGSIGIILGLFSVGCAACGALLFGLFGFPLALMLLPFKGLELKVLSIILMSISIYYLSKSFNNYECKIIKDSQ